ncbi:MAG: hypothetical protein AAF108_04895 [Planctomycetota bacterium]
MSDPDVRQSELKEGAGLDESRLNTEFIEALQKYASPLLFVAAGVVLAFVGWGRLQDMQNDAVNDAYQNYSEVAESANPNPVSLRVIAEEHGGVRSIGIQTRLREADVYLDSVRSGLVPGASQQFGADPAEEDTLTDEDRAKYLDDAERLYRAVAEEAGTEPGARLHAIGALFGVAAVLEERGDADAAVETYERLAAMADEAGFETSAAIARGRAASVGDVLAAGELPSQDDLPQAEPEPASEDGLDLSDIDVPELDVPELDVPDVEAPALDLPGPVAPVLDEPGEESDPAEGDESPGAADPAESEPADPEAEPQPAETDADTGVDDGDGAG